MVPETGSTNADLAAQARAGARPGSVLVTGHQSAGRGRQGRTWTAPPGTAVALSVLVAPDVPVQRWTWLPLVAGLAVSDALRQAADVPAVLKWPNDVLILDRKVCGILAERVETPYGPACVVGMGINIDLTEDQLPVPTATSLAIATHELGGSAVLTTRTQLVAQVLVSLARILEHWAGLENDAALAVAYRERCVTLGRRVRVMLAGDQVVQGTAEDVDAEGRLVVRTETGVQVFGAGDIVHLR
ncbi:MAG: biotin--[acetyl-CoA-carboxylase] ligase [Friedmanniella sp.]|nr:biotin--[acetyl-CoA-carboxylase] ligase [Friedmanniella sp.]